jgi:[acyl-carrier-protein] S-malonyltransferase
MKIAYIYPGQGAQHAGMGMEFYHADPVYKAMFDELEAASGLPLKATVETGENIALTEYTQPVLYAMGMGLTAMLEKRGVKPDVCAGLSLGEYGALSAAGALDPKDGVLLLRKRGMFMQEAVPAGVGGLAAIVGLTFDAVKEVADASGVTVSNYNLENQIVVGGELSLLEKACGLAKEKGAKLTKMLEVSAPFHTPMLKPAGEKLASELEKVAFKPLKAEVYANVTGEKYAKDADIRKILADQVSSTVMWYNCMKGMIADGVELYLELGPGSTLAAMLKKIDRGANVVSVNTPADFEKVLEMI